MRHNTAARQASRRRGGCASSFLILIAFAFLFAIAGGFFAYRALTTPYQGFSGPFRNVEVRRGASTASILRKLRGQGVLRDDFVPLLYVKAMRRGESLKAGIYQFKGESSPLQVIDKLVRGDVLLKSITVREGLDRFSIGELLSAERFGSAVEWRKLTGAPSLIEDLDPKADSLEGYLFPDTYRLSPGTRPEVVVKLMVDNFRTHFGDQLALISNGLDLHQTVTLASIVETEARLAQERSMIASVYLNRLRKNMLLQADPTVIYAMKLKGTWKGNIRRVDLQMNSPYNTYRSRGLPPGPIANPGLASLRAAAFPADTDYLYFVSRNDGSHVFARTLDEHNRNVVTYQKRPFRQRPQPISR